MSVEMWVVCRAAGSRGVRPAAGPSQSRRQARGSHRARPRARRARAAGATSRRRMRQSTTNATLPSRHHRDCCCRRNAGSSSTGTPAGPSGSPDCGPIQEVRIARTMLVGRRVPRLQTAGSSTARRTASDRRQKPSNSPDGTSVVDDGAPATCLAAPPAAPEPEPRAAICVRTPQQRRRPVRVGVTAEQRL